MKIRDLTETIMSMSELAEIMPDIVQLLAQLDQAVVTADAERREIALHTKFLQQPLTVTYLLRSGDQREFHRLLSAALRSNSGGAAARQSVVASINNLQLRRHALNYLTNPQRWKATGMRLAGQQLPAPGL